MSLTTGIDGDAPVIARHEIDINAPLETVWRLQTDVNDWPAWQTDITAAHLDGPFEPGNSFTWTSYGFTVTSTIYAVEDHSRTLWRGANLGIMGTHEPPPVPTWPRTNPLAASRSKPTPPGCNQPWTSH
jgi:hypothetical protein